MRKLFLIILLFTNLLCKAQQGNPVQNFSFWNTLNVGKGAQVNTDPSAYLEIGNLTGGVKGIILPRVSDINNIPSPKVGGFAMQVKAGDTSVWYYTWHWVKILSNANTDNQQLTLSNDSLTISNGNTVVLPYVRSVVFLDSIEALSDRIAAISGGVSLPQLNDSLLKYVRIRDSATKYTSVYANSLKLNKTDTPNMLLPYVRKGDSTVLYITLKQLKDSLNAHPGSVVSVNGQTGVVSLTTTNIPEGTNKYFTDVRVCDDSVIYLAYVKTLIAGKVGYGDTGLMLLPYITTAEVAATYVAQSAIQPINRGGTGQTTATAALNALLPSQTGKAGYYGSSNGTDFVWVANTNVGSLYSSNSSLTIDPPTGALVDAIINLAHGNSWTSTQTFQGITITDGYNVSLGTSTGTKIGTSSSQKLGFLGTTPVIRQSGDVGTALVANGLMESPSYDYASITGVPAFVTGLTVVTTHGFSGSFTSGATPALTINTTVTGVVKGNGTSLSAATVGTDYTTGMSGLATGLVKNTTGTGNPVIATAGTDYENPLTFTSGLTRSSNTVTNDLIVGKSGGQTIIGGTGTTDMLSFKNTTGNQVSGTAYTWLGGNNGASTLMTLTYDGKIGNATWNGTSISTTYTDAKIKTVTGTSNRLTIGGTSTDPTFDISTSYAGQNTIVTLGVVSTATWQATAIADAYISSATNWNTAYTNRITSLTTTGSSGASTLISNTLNIPTYTLAGLGGISLTSLSSTITGITYTNTTGVFSLTAGYVVPTTTEETNWNIAYTNRITSLTTTGSSGAATLISNTLNIPTYTLSGLGGVSTARILTINGTAQDLSSDRTWNVGDALVANPLSQFASTTSAQLATVISNETGSGALAFATNPTLGGVTFTDATDIVFNTTTGTKIGTSTSQKLAFYNSTPITKPSGDVATALTNLGLISSPTVIATTNANLTGVITSVGNATSIAAQTGTGTTFVVQTSPTLVTPVLGVATATSLNGNFFTTGTYTLTGASGKTLTFNNSLTFSGTDATTMTFPASSTTVGGLSIQQTWTKGNAGAIVTLTDAATIAIDLSLGNNYEVVLGGNRNLGIPTNITKGQVFVVSYYQDITGGRTGFSSPGWCYTFYGGTAPTLTTTKGALDKIVYTVDNLAISTVTMTSATPCVVTWTSHGLKEGQKLQFTTTGALYTGLAVSTTYWVTLVDANSFKLSSSQANFVAGTFINTSGSQSGVHTGTAINISGTVGCLDCK